MAGRQVASASTLDEESSGGLSATKPPRTRSQIGKSNSAKGKESERRVASYLKVNGWPQAGRLVRTGYRNGENVSRDEGDIGKTPGLAWQVKYVAEKDWWKVPQWMAATEDQRIASGADYGILVVRRHGHAHPSEWWAYLWAADVVSLVVGRRPSPGLDLGASLHFPVRFELHNLIPILHARGYGLEGVA